MESDHRDESSRFSTFMTGAVIGAGIALLLAPQTGVELRRLKSTYMKRAKKEVDRTTEMLDNAVEHGQEFVERGKDSLRETSRQAKDSVEAGRQSFKETKDQLSSQHH